jgi:hypothetical protein
VAVACGLWNLEFRKPKTRGARGRGLLALGHPLKKSRAVPVPGARSQGGLLEGEGGHVACGMWRFLFLFF